MNRSARRSNMKHQKVVFPIAIAIAISVPLVLPGCHLPELRQADPGPVVPADFKGRTSPDNSARLGINEFFCDPVLTGMITQALAGNQELKILNQEIQVANNEIQARRGAYLPFVSLRGEAGVDNHSLYTPLGAVEEEIEYLPGEHFPDPLPNFLLSADVFWRVDIWRELRNARDAAQQRYIAAIENRNYFVTQLVAEIADNYYELAALDKQIEYVNQTIALQENSLKIAKSKKAAGSGTELAVQRFLAEVRRNQSEKLIIQQEIVEVENRINFLVGRYPQDVQRQSWDFITLDSRALSVGVPAQLLRNRRDIREAERELAAAGLDVKVARARFFPRLDIVASVGFEAFNPKYLFEPEALIANVAGGLVAPFINRKAIKADYLSANASQLQAVYNYQRVVLNAFTEVVNRVSKVEKYRNSVEIKKGQLESLEASVNVATKLFQNARAEYVEVLLAQRDLLEARIELVDTKQQQLSAIVNAYQALGGGDLLSNSPEILAVIDSPPTMIPPPAPADPNQPPAPADQDSSPVPTDPAASPAPADPALPPTPLDPALLPTPAEPAASPAAADPVLPPTPLDPALSPVPADPAPSPTPADPDSSPVPED